MVLKLELTFCHRCQCNHPFGQHKGKAPAKLPASMSQTPIAVALHSYTNGQNGVQPKLAIGFRHKMVPESRQEKLPATKPPKAPGKAFDKVAWQKEEMRDRREADRLGFGGKRINPDYKTVKQFRIWRDKQAAI